eukprot:3781088-Heterocapsa_arctica.AAC.1
MSAGARAWIGLARSLRPSGPTGALGRRSLSSGTCRLLSGTCRLSGGTPDCEDLRIMAGLRQKVDG